MLLITSFPSDVLLGSLNNLVVLSILMNVLVSVFHCCIITYHKLSGYTRHTLTSS